MARILLVESDKLIAGNLRGVLKKAGHQVNWHVDPQAALDAADLQLPEAVIVDLVLANHGGIEFLYEFRSYPEWQEVPVIVFSSLSAEELKEALAGFEHLNVSAYHYKLHTTLSELTKSIDRILQPVKA